MTRIIIDIYYSKFLLDCYFTHGWYQDYHQTDNRDADKEDAIQFQPVEKNSIAVLDSLECVIFRPGDGFIMHRTFRTTPTPVNVIENVSSTTFGLNSKIKE